MNGYERIREFSQWLELPGWIEARLVCIYSRRESMRRASELLGSAGINAAVERLGKPPSTIYRQAKAFRRMHKVA